MADGRGGRRVALVLADPTRVSLLAQLALASRPLPVGELAECCSPHLSVISRHLATLRDAGIVESQRVGKEVHYRLDCAALAATLRQLADALDTCCPQPEKGSSP
jgi:DNA-binding transcriptional ArsR family regulator